MGRTIEAGSTNALFIENNSFLIDTDADREPNQLIYHQQGGRTVTRYNDFNGNDYTTTGKYSLFYDSHGNQNYYDTGTGAGTFRGQPILEIYNNNMTGYRSYRMVDFRGGSVLFHHNKLTTQTGAAPFIDVTEEEAWSTSHFETGLDSTWPAEDQLTNSFFYSNTCNGGSCAVTPRNAADNEFIRSDETRKDYFTAAPADSGGKTTYTSRAGAAGNAADGTLTWSAEGANAYYPYTTYDCPHPLTGLTAGTCDNTKYGTDGYNNLDIVAPADPSCAINTAGSSFTVTFSEAVTHGAGGTTGWVLTSDGGAVTATYSSGAGSTALVYQLSRTVYSTETVTGTYTQPGTPGITDIAGNLFASVTDVSITNNSTATSGAPTYPKMTLSTGSNVTLSPSGTGSFTLAP